MIDEDHKNLGVMPRDAALNLAKEKRLDLIEIAPSAKPPVARIISFDKFRYEKEKELRKQRAGQKVSELKHVRISGRSAQNDLDIKARQAEKFLSQGHKVEINLVLRGREKFNKEWAKMKLNEFLKMINTDYKITLETKFGGRGLNVQIVKPITSK